MVSNIGYTQQRLIPPLLLQHVTLALDMDI